MRKKISFHGSRILDNENVIEKIDEVVKKYEIDYIITHGDASGVCSLVQEYCKKNSIPLKLYFLNKKYGRGKYYYRSLQVIEESDICVFIHDGKSKGTLNELEMAKKLNKEIIYYKVEDTGVDVMLEMMEFDVL